MLHKMHVVVGDVRVMMYQSVGKKNCQMVYNLVSESEDSNAEVDDAAWILRAILYIIAQGACIHTSLFVMKLTAKRDMDNQWYAIIFENLCFSFQQETLMLAFQFIFCSRVYNVLNAFWQSGDPKTTIFLNKKCIIPVKILTNRVLLSYRATEFCVIKWNERKI